MYKWDADEDDFAMPVEVGTPDHWQIIHPDDEVAVDADAAHER